MNHRLLDPARASAATEDKELAVLTNSNPRGSGSLQARMASARNRRATRPLRLYFTWAGGNLRPGRHWPWWLRTRPGWRWEIFGREVR